MKWTSRLVAGGLALWFAALGCPAYAQKDSWTTPLVITLVPEITVDDSIVTLEQIARLSGSTLELRRRVAKLDVAELKTLAERMTVSADQVKFRLLLAGVDPALFRLSGAKRVMVQESDEPITLRKIRARAEAALRQNYPGDSSTISVSMSQDFTIPFVQTRPADRVTLEAKVGPHLPRAGKTRVDVAIVVNGRTRETVPVVLEVSTADSNVLPAFNAMRSGNSGLPITTVANIAPANKEPILVKTGGIVKMIARIGTIRIETVGEAMQEGKLHETIRVRNIESGRVVPGIVMGHGVVDVDY